jgi:hypothetical protein
MNRRMVKIGKPGWPEAAKNMRELCNFLKANGCKVLEQSRHY